MNKLWVTHIGLINKFCIFLYLYTISTANDGVKFNVSVLLLKENNKIYVMTAHIKIVNTLSISLILATMKLKNTVY